MDAADKLYTLTVKTAPCHAEDLTEKDFHSLLTASGVISADHPLPKTLENISCFTVISEYKCGYICHMCPYAKRNKNERETEESLLLSYAIKNYTNLQFLKKSGLDSKVFCSLFLLNDLPDGKIVSTLPLLKLSYQYLERVTDQHTDFSSLPSMIAGALDQNNKGRLLPQNVQTIREYLTKLQKTGGSISQGKVTDILNRTLHSVKDPVAITDTTVLSSANSDAHGKPQKTECILGFLDKVSDKEKKPAALPVEDISYKSEFHADKMITKGENTNKKPSSALTQGSDKESLYLPAVFSPSEAEQTGFPFNCISDNTADLQQLEIFLQFNPVVGMEIVEDAETKEQMILLCASGQFYYIHPDHPQALSLLSLYFAKSVIRRQICMEPYKLYHFLQTNGIYHKNVYSLRTAYKLLAENRGSQNIKTPSEMVKELTSKTNLYGYSPYIFTMLQYVKMYDVLSSQEIFKQAETQNKLRTLSFLDSLLGISYELRNVAETADPLFCLDENGDRHFLYRPELKMKEGIYSVTFSFSSDNPCGCLVTDILYRIARKDLAKIQGYRLLQYRSDSFTIATAAQHYEYLCEVVSNLATYLAEKQDLIPLIIKEDIIK